MCLNIYLELPDIFVQSVYIGGTGSHVQRLLVHVHMYTMYYLSVVLFFLQDVARFCSLGVKGGKPYTSPILPPPLAFPHGEKNILYSISYEFLLRVKKMPVMWRAMLWRK